MTTSHFADSLLNCLVDYDQRACRTANLLQKHKSPLSFASTLGEISRSRNAARPENFTTCISNASMERAPHDTEISDSITFSPVVSESNQRPPIHNGPRGSGKKRVCFDGMVTAREIMAELPPKRLNANTSFTPQACKKCHHVRSSANH